MASQIQNDALQRASQVDSAQRYDHADYIAYQRMQLLAQKKERDLTADETAKLQGEAGWIEGRSEGWNEATAYCQPLYN